MTRTAAWLGAGAIAGILVAHAISWSPSQLLWACHLASLAIALGLVFDRPVWIAAGVLFHAGEGIPAFVLDLIAVGDLSVTSILTHTVPILLGGWALWGKPLPRRILLRAWLLQLIAMVAAYLWSDPALDIMLVHAPYGPTAGLFPSLWMSWIVCLVLSLVCLSIGLAVLRVVWRRWR